jgi:DNA polymerase I-like protein with 3'-5' exonuclease and polymerase domains
MMLPQHLEDLRRSGLADATIDALHLESLDDPQAARQLLGWPVPGRLGPFLKFPFFEADGSVNGYARLKPDHPRTKDNKLVRYESPKGQPNRAYIPPAVAALLADASKPLCLSEGEKKSAKATQEGFPCIGLVGVWGWQAKRDHQGGPRRLIADLAAVAWKGRPVYLVYDSDVAQKRDVEQARWNLAQVLSVKGAVVKIVELPAGPEGEKVGLDDFLVAQGAEAFRALLETAQDPRPPKDNRPKVFLSHEEHWTIDYAVESLAGGDKNLYQRGGQLVRITRPRHPAAGRRLTTSGAPFLEVLPAADLRTRITRTAQIITVAEKEGLLVEVPAHPPPWLVQGIAALPEWPNVRPIESVVETPVLLPDGSVLQKPGYHADSGLYYAADGDYPPVPEAPTLRDARTALRALEEPIVDFPFKAPEHKSAWLAALLTPIARFAFEGPAPLFLADANIRGAGKGLLVELCSWIAMGRDFAVVPYKRDAAEFEKSITSVALAGERMMILDNVSGFLGNAALDAALTSTHWQGRILGSSKQPRTPLLATWYATGNNLAVGADTTRRVCPIRLESPDEHPETRTGFKIPDLPGWVRLHRRRLLSAALTILSAYLKAGMPEQHLEAWGSYGGWSALIRGALCWLGLPDPAGAREELEETADGEVHNLRCLLAGWEEIDPEAEGLTAKEVVDKLKAAAEADYPTMREALAENFGTSGGKLPRSSSLGYRLRKFRGRNVGGKCFTCRSLSKGVQKWLVRTIRRGGDGGDGGDESPGPSAPNIYSPTEEHFLGTGDPEVSSPPSPPSPPSLPRTSALEDGTPVQLIRDSAELAVVRQALDESERVGLDVETTGLSPRKDRMRLLQLATDRGVFIVDCFGVDPSPLFESLAGVEIVCHNAAFDLAFLWQMGFRPGKITDLMILSRLLTAGTKTGNSLADLASRELGVELDKSQQKSTWGGELSQTQLRYAARDAHVTRDLYAATKTQIMCAEMEAVAAIEMRAIPAFLWLACSGAPFDQGAWTVLAQGAEERERQIVEQLDAASPPREGCLSGDAAWNWNSPREVVAAFAALGITLPNADDVALAGVDHPLAAAIRAHRSASQMVKTFGRKWPKDVHDGRIYGGYVQLGNDDGRSSCKKPNLQQVPKDPAYRRCFPAPKGRVLVKADYSQLHLRIACRVAQERKMLDAYKRGDDLHTLTAASITGKKKPTKDDRQLAKAVNFGLLYGMGANGLRGYAKQEYGVELTYEQARQYRQRFFQTYPKLAAWHEREGHSTATESRSFLGRRRLLDAKTPIMFRLSSPVLGAEADGTKTAMALLWERKGQCEGAHPVLFVHDEIVVECDADKADAAAAWLKTAMIDGMTPVLGGVPCEVETKIAPTWGD